MTEGWSTGAATAVADAFGMPLPVAPVDPVAPLLADVTVDGAVVSVRVHEWCEAELRASLECLPRWAGWLRAAARG